MPPFIAAAWAISRGLPWKAIGMVVMAIGLTVAGWTARGWLADRDAAEVKAATAIANTTASEQARDREQVLADAIAIIDAEQTAERSKDHEEIDRLSGALAADTAGLRVAAHCTAAGMPDASPGPGMGAGTSAELETAARPAYLALRRGLADQRQQLLACQAVLMGERQ